MGANEAFGAANRNRDAGADIKRSQTRLCAQAAIVGGVQLIKKPFLVHFHWFEPNQRRDLDNIRYASKYILDGLRECGRLPNDGWAWVKGMSDTFSVDERDPRVEVSINEIPAPSAREEGTV